jgi:hypoxanthine phosphoribosyltransferase
MPLVRGKTIEVLFSAAAIEQRILELAEEISRREFDNLLIVSILKGSFVFAADLIRALNAVGLAPEVEFLFVSSYGANAQAGELKLLRDIDSRVAGRDVLVVDDILESGNTLAFTRNLLLGRGARRVEIAVLLAKQKPRKSGVEADFVGFACPDLFVVGYGMDLAHAFRELPYVGVIKD